MLQLEAKTNFFTPNFFASLANFTQFKKLISFVASLNSFPIGSFETAARYIITSGMNFKFFNLNCLQSFL